MNILFIGYWPFHEGLTQATILPHLKILSKMDKVQKVIFTSIERNSSATSFDLNIPKVQHLPIYSKNLPINLLNKLYDFIYFPKIYIDIIKSHNIDKVICRGAPAGALGYLVWKSTGIPYYVESFEPHADYMLESGVWKRYDPRYLMQKHWEKQQKKTARGLMPVAENYRHQLMREGIHPDKIITVPCSVDSEKFKFNKDDREKIRKQLGIHPHQIVGVYLGKFGGIYYDNEAFHLFKEAFCYFGDRFFLLILSPQEKSSIVSRIHKVGLKANRFVSSKAHQEIPSYLSAADFAFSLYLPSSSKRFLSPIKNGEYWANGLPVLIPDGIGDDSNIIKIEGGVILDWKNLEETFRKMETMIHGDHRSFIPQLAKRYRDPYRIVEAYKKFLNISSPPDNYKKHYQIIA